MFGDSPLPGQMPRPPNNDTKAGSIQTIVSYRLWPQAFARPADEQIAVLKVLHSLSRLVAGDRSFFLREMPYYEIPGQHSGSGLGNEVLAEAFLLPSWRC
jgi:hypothetical protein